MHVQYFSVPFWNSESELLEFYRGIVKTCYRCATFNVMVFIEITWIIDCKQLLIFR